jgi:hypothetical protein
MGSRGPKPVPVFDRLVRKAEWEGDCLVWTGFRNPKGYGTLTVRSGETRSTHRMMWTEHFGDPGEMCVLHECDNPPCMNPEHLFLGDRPANNADMRAKGRQRARGMLPECRRGHLYDKANTYWTPKGARYCRACHREAQQRYLGR